MKNYNSHSNFYATFLGMALSNVSEPDRNDLGAGLRLVPIEFEEEDGYNDKGYGHLYKDDVKVSDVIYRRGGLGGDVKDGYVMLLSYKDFKESTGNWVILDIDGKEVMRNTEKYSGNYLYHIKGNIAKLKDVYYNLKTGKEIAYGSSSIESDQYLFVQHRYDWGNKEFPTGVYKIDFYTVEVEFYPIIK